MKEPFKKQEMEKFYQSGDNPWGYGDKHSEVYRYMFGEIENELPEFLFVLELGCRDGHFAKMLLDHFKNRIAYYIGIDISVTAIKNATKRLKKYQNTFLSVEDFESGDSWTKYAGDVNFVIANECLCYCDRPKTVIEKLDKHIVRDSYLLVVDSIIRYVTRESPHRDFNFEFVKKIIHNSCFIDGRRWSVKAFLTRKLNKRGEKK
jgi:SAM-dependent methyltransferase